MAALTDLPEPLHVVCGFRPDVTRLERAGLTVTPDLPTGQPKAAIALVCLPRNRGQALGTLATALGALAPGGRLYVDGAKTDGVEATLRALRAVLPLEGVISKAHGKIAWAHRPTPEPAALTEALATWATAASPVEQAGYLTAPGMFSAAGLDAGSARLIEHLPAETKGPVADLGAGWGALSRALLARAPEIESCDLIEADHASLTAAKANVADPRAQFHWADATSFEGGPYRLIISNPPFHTGRAADPALGQAFIDAAARLVHPKGRVLMVANRQLPYERRFEELFHSWSLRAADSRFKIIEAHHPRRSNRAR